MCASTRLGPAPAPARVADAEQPCCINEPFVALHTVVVVTVPTVCTVTVMQQKMKQLCPGSIPARFLGQPRALHFRSITLLFPFFSLFPSLLLFRNLDHHYYIHYYTVITTLLPLLQ